MKLPCVGAVAQDRYHRQVAELLRQVFAHCDILAKQGHDPRSKGISHTVLAGSWVRYFGYAERYHLDAGLVQQVPDALRLPVRHRRPAAKDADPDLLAVVHSLVSKIR